MRKAKTKTKTKININLLEMVSFLLEIVYKLIYSLNKLLEVLIVN